MAGLSCFPEGSYMNSGSAERGLVLGVVMAFGLLLTICLPAMASAIDCTGTVEGGDMESVRVPQNGICTLKDTLVKGDITVAPKATLYAFSSQVGGTIRVSTEATLNAFNVRVKGDIEAEDAAQVSVFSGSFVGGSIRGLRTGGAEIDGAEIGGDLVLNKTGRSLKVAKAVVGGDLQVLNTTGRSTLIGNTIKGKLECQGNVFTPEGGGNAVNGSMEGQCRDLHKPPPPEEDCCEIQ